jgi:hypothetical protein
MFMQRLLVLLTGAFFSVFLGLGLIFWATQPPPLDLSSVRPDESESPAEAPNAPPTAPPGEASTEKVAPPLEEMGARNRVAAAIDSAPEYQKFFTRLREAFPADYDSALDYFSTRLAEGQNDGADYYVSEAVRRLRQARGVLAARAEGPALERVFALQLEVLKALAKNDKKLCVAFLDGAANQDFQVFASGRRGLIGEMALAGVEAIASGQNTKLERARPTEADFKALETVLTAKKLGKAEIDALLDGKTPNPPLDDARMCAAGLSYLEALRAMPEATRQRIYGFAVELMARG